MSKNLVIVESPAKAKTIEKFLGEGFLVTSSFGHIRDLPSGKLAVKVGEAFEPEYTIPADKKKVVSELKKLAKSAEEVWLATDEDREGEAISWHLCQALGLDDRVTKRIVFHEITKTAIKEAIENPRRINRHLVDAQQARRVLDRLVGFELSPLLWKKVKPSLSAGRVQSVAVRLVVERERDILAYKPEASFKSSGVFQLSGSRGKLKAELDSRIGTSPEVESFLANCSQSTFVVEDVSVRPGKRTPAAPFTTSTLQQEASRKLGFSVSRTMSVAQRLYESGNITYMRTDSVNLSELALQASRQSITDLYGSQYSKTRQYSNKVKSAQEAHEAIRPTDLGKSSISGSSEEQRLYDLIWKRTIASQMADAQLEKTTISIGISKDERRFKAEGEVIKFDGFLKVYLESTDEEDDKAVAEGLLPRVEVGETLACESIESRQRFSRPPSRYHEASLVKKLEELGIGRPSTYAPTISTVQKRGYVLKESREGQERSVQVFSLKGGVVESREEKERFGVEKNKLFPADIGMMVTDFLSDHFKGVMDYGFTAKVEGQFDRIARGEDDWQKMLEQFYTPFHSLVEKTTEEAERVSQERELGSHPDSGLPIFAKFGKYGPYIQVGEATEDKKPRYAKMKPGQLIESISLEEALDLLKLPRVLGEFDGAEISADIGRFGPYVRHEKLFASIPKGEMDPYTITLEEGVELIKAKREAEANKYINSFEHEGKTIEVLRGRWGPYIKADKTNYKIPKTEDAEKLDLEQVLHIMANQPKKGTKRKKKA